MSYKLKNIINGQLVSNTAKENKTLRLNAGEQTTLNDDEMTKHIFNLVSLGYLSMVKVTDHSTNLEVTDEKTVKTKSKEE